MIISTVGCSSTSTETSEESTPTPLPTSIIPTKPTYVVEKGDVIEEMQFNARDEVLHNWRLSSCAEPVIACYVLPLQNRMLEEVPALQHERNHPPQLRIALEATE